MRSRSPASTASSSGRRSRVVLDDEPLELGARERAAGEGRGRRREEERGQPLAAGARVGARVGEDQPLGRLRQRAVEEAARLEEAVLGGGERRSREGGWQARPAADGRAFRGAFARDGEERELGGSLAGTGARARGGGECRRIPRAPAGNRSRDAARILDSERFALRVQEKGIRPEHARVAAFDEAGDRDHAEGQARHRVEGAHVDGAALEGLERQPLPLEARLEDLLHLGPRRAGGHRPEAAEVGDHLEHRVAVALGADPLVDDGAQPLDPLRPGRLAGEAVERPAERAPRRAAAPRRRPRGAAVARAGRGPSPTPPASRSASPHARRPRIQRLRPETIPASRLVWSQRAGRGGTSGPRSSSNGTGAKVRNSITAGRSSPRQRKRSSSERAARPKRRGSEGCRRCGMPRRESRSVKSGA